MRQRFFDLSIDKPDLPPDERNLYRLLASVLIFIPVMQFLVGIGVATIASLNLAGLFDNQEPLLFAIAAVSTLNSCLHLPLFPLLRKNKLGIVSLLLFLINGISFASQVFLWDGILWLPLALILSLALLFAIAPGLSVKMRGTILALGIVLVAGVFYINGQIGYTRLPTNNLATNAALAIYLLLSATMLALGVLNSLISYQTLSSRLVTIFTTATVLIILITIIIGSLSNYLDSRKRAFQQLEAISNLKTAQINTVLANLKTQANQPIANQSVAQRIQYLLSNNPNDLSYRFNLDLVRSHLSSLQKQIPGSTFLLLNAQGQVLVSTNRNVERNDFSQFGFMQAAEENLPFVIEKGFPGAQTETVLLVLSPLRAEKAFLGVIVLQTDFSEIDKITNTTPGTSQTLETYLVSKIGDEFTPTTSTNGHAREVITYPTEQVFSARISRGTSIYNNYANLTVLGHFIWLEELQSVLISEISQQEVWENISDSLYISISIGLVMIVLTFVVVTITSQSISRSIQDLAEKATSLASGELSTRIPVIGEDEIGTLASNFNMMASELESIVHTLEAKVEERTKDLQKQANYLRIASEVARDATTAQDPDELLNQAAQLILDRFHFYHTGIFLIDADREFAVLRASPTEAGQKMLERGHKLRLGQVGIVGYVAATGIPRIALDTGQDAAYFNNPLLPNTRSEIAIPLKLDEKVIGVLDVQSTQPEAFTQEDISILQIMADQLALAIQRVELVDNLQRNFSELENTYKTFTADSWRSFSQETDFRPGYQFDGIKITPLTSFPQETQDLLSKGSLTVIHHQQDSAGATVAAPLKLRDQVIGILTLRFQTDLIDQDTLTLIEDVAGRLAVALENARLYAETRNLVQRERAVSEISSRIATSFNVENILRTAVMEIGKMMPDAEVVVQLEQDKE